MCSSFISPRSSLEQNCQGLSLIPKFCSSFARRLTRNLLEVVDSISLRILEKGNTCHLFSVYGAIFSSWLSFYDPRSRSKFSVILLYEVSQVVLFCHSTPARCKITLPKPTVNANDNKLRGRSLSNAPLEKPSTCWGQFVREVVLCSLGFLFTKDLINGVCGIKIGKNYPLRDQNPLGTVRTDNSHVS